MFKKLFAILFVVILLCSCGPNPQVSDQGFLVSQKINTNLYFLEIRIDDEVKSHTEIQGNFGGFVANGYGSMGGRVWQDGKGLLRGELISVEPSVDFASVGNQIIVKTTDLKIISLRDGEIVSLVCTVDYEPICAKNEEGYVGECYDLWEFDYCRMIGFEPIQ